MKEFSRKRPANTVISGKSAERQEDRKMAENIAKSDDFTRGAEAPRPITVRFAPEIASRLEADARERDASPTEIVRAIVCAHYSEAGRQTELMRELGDLIEDRFRHLVYEISRTRSSLYNMVEQSPELALDRPKLKEIQQWSRADASDYLTRLDAEIEGRKNLGKASGAALRE
jgi:hypothetical protein